MSQILSFLQTIGILLLVLVIFNFIILIHEWGHFLAARWRGLQVDKFQIWFGKPIWKKTINGVQYGLGSIPLGGFVALPQMAPMEAIEGNSEGTENRAKLPPIKPLDKIIVAFAGPLFSFLLAVVCSFIVWKAGVLESRTERDTSIGYVMPDMPAAKGGLKVGDKITAINGNPVLHFTAMTDSVIWEIISSETDAIAFDILRDGAPMKIVVTAKMEDLPEFKQWNEKNWWQKLSGRPPMRKVGIAPVEDNYVVEKLLPNSPAALAGVEPGDKLMSINGVPLTSHMVMNQAVRALLPESVQKMLDDDISPKREDIKITGSLVLGFLRGAEKKDITVSPRLPDKPDTATYPALGIEWLDNRDIRIVHPTPKQQIGKAFQAQFSMLKKLMPGSGSKIGAAHMNSAVGIVSMYHQLFQIENGWRMILSFTVLLNISLAILNLIPFPVLDGGHIVMGIFEMVRGRPPGGKALENFQQVCVLMLLSFMAWLILKDVTGLVTTDSADGPIEFLPPPASIITK